METIELICYVDDYRNFNGSSQVGVGSGSESSRLEQGPGDVVGGIPQPQR